MFNGMKRWTGSLAGLVLILSILACGFGTPEIAPTADTSGPLPTAIPTADLLQVIQPSPAAASPDDAAATAAPTAAAGIPVTGADLTSGIREVAGRVRPAVVQITNLQVQIGNFTSRLRSPRGLGPG